MGYRVFKSKDNSKILVNINTGNSLAISYKNGIWEKNILFDAYELEDLLLVKDKLESKKLYEKAIKALKKQKSIQTA